MLSTPDKCLSLVLILGNQKNLNRQIQCQFQGKRHIAITAMAQGKKH